jgi:hypothetical protein
VLALTLYVRLQTFLVNCLRLVQPLDCLFWAFWAVIRVWEFRMWPAPEALVRAAVGFAVAESAQPLLFFGLGLLLPFLRWPGACGLLPLYVRPLDAYASLRPYCLRHCVSELRLPSVLQSCA